MEREWFPQCTDLASQIAAASSAETPAARWKALRALANHNHDFAATVRLDRAIRREQEKLGDHNAGLTAVKLAILSTSTTSHLTAGIRVASLGRGLLLDIYEPDYGQVRQELADPNSGLRGFAPTAVLFANDPYSLVGDPGGLTGDGAAAVRSLVEDLPRQWRAARDLFKASVIQQLPFNPMLRLMGENEHRLPGSAAELVRLAREALRAAAEEDGVAILDMEHWAMRGGLAAWHSPALWHRSKQEIHPSATPFYGDLVARLLAAQFGKSAKCLVLDLDNTLWGGVIGDDGLQGIVLGQGSAIGEAHLAFQRYAKQLSQRGVILAVCSKNDEAVARSAFESHPEMALRMSDISCFVANWTDKASNLRRIAQELNIGIDALVFADDNPFERNLIRAELPEVFTPEFTDDAADYARIIADSGCFECLSLTKDDLARTEQYKANAERKALMGDATDMDGYLAALDMRLEHGPFDEVGLQRIVQLINKTNQFNLTTRRYTDAAVRELLANPQAVTLQLRLLDRFGDNGIIAIVIGVLSADNDLKIDTWLMSCRVLGRQVEAATLNLLAEAAKAIGARTLVGEYIPTERNGMVKDHYAKLGFVQVSDSDGHTAWSLPLAGFAPTPTHITTEAKP